MNRFFLKLIAGALAVGAAGSQAAADPVWHFPYKGTPYATNDDDPHITRIRTVARRTAREPAHYAPARKSNPSLNAGASGVRAAATKAAPQG